jgi:hypothetical protein
MVDLIAGDDATLQNHLRWFPLAGRSSVGLRWGLGVQLTNQTKQPDLAKPDDWMNLTGPLGPAMVTGLQERVDRGDFGQWPQLGDPRFRQVALLGGGKTDELRAAARRQGLDLLVVAELRQIIARKAVTDMEMKVRIVDVAEGKTLWTSKPIKRSDLVPTPPVGPIKGGGLAPKPAGKTDPAADFVAEVLKGVDTKCSLDLLPEKTSAEAKNRLKSLAQASSNSKGEDSLRPLVELRGYQAGQWLTTAEVSTYYDGIVGAGKGRALASGDEATRRQVLQAWLGRSSPLPPPPRKKPAGSAAQPAAASPRSK